MKIVLGRHRQERKVKDLHLEPRELEDAPELKISWTDEDGLSQTAWVKCSTLRTIRTVNEKKAK